MLSVSAQTRPSSPNSREVERLGHSRPTNPTNPTSTANVIGAKSGGEAMGFLAKTVNYSI